MTQQHPVRAFALAALTSTFACRSEQDLGAFRDPVDGGTAATETAPPTGPRVFVTSTTYKGDLAAAGGKGSALASADAICQTAAESASLGGRFIAYLSVGTMNAAARIQGDGPLYLVDGKTVAYTNKAQIGAGSKAPLLSEKSAEAKELASGVDEFGRPAYASLPSSFWTGTNGAGVGTDEDCARWTSRDVLVRGSHASSLGASTYQLGCNQDHGLLCVEQPEAAPAATKRVFMTSKSYDGALRTNGTVFDAVDGHCARAARAAGLEGDFVAWFSGRDASNRVVRALDRIAGETYALLDGTIVIAARADFARTPLAPIDVDELGAKVNGAFVWTGTLQGGTPAQRMTCQNWTSNSNRDAGVFGVADPNDLRLWSGPAQDDATSMALDCSQSGHLYCFER